MPYNQRRAKIPAIHMSKKFISDVVDVSGLSLVLPKDVMSCPYVVSVFGIALAGFEFGTFFESCRKTSRLIIIIIIIIIVVSFPNDTTTSS
jgi:hypothetical protein